MTQTPPPDLEEMHRATEARNQGRTMPVDEMRARMDARRQAAQADGGSPHRIQFWPAGMLRVREPDWRWLDYIERDSLVGVFGPSESAKSLLINDLCLSMATGRDAWGITTAKGTVCVLPGEGQSGIARRNLAWSIARQTDISLAHVYYSDQPAAIDDPSSVQDVIHAIEDRPGPPDLVVVDTLARNFGAGDENSTRDMGRFIAGLDQIRTRYQCAIIVIHHTGHAAPDRARGAGAFRAALDAEYAVTRGADDVIRLSCTKMKDASRPDPLAFKFRSVDLGMLDAHGRAVTGVVLDRVDWTEPASQARTGTGRHQRTALAVLDQMTDPTLSDWKARMKMSGIDRRRITDVIRSLTDAGQIYISNDSMVLRSQ
jgi:hypothetical protein